MTYNKMEYERKLGFTKCHLAFGEKRSRMSESVLIIGDLKVSNDECLLLIHDRTDFGSGLMAHHHMR